MQAYKDARKVLDYRREIYLDMLHIYHEAKFTKGPNPQLDALRDQLKFDGDFVLINLNCKDYKNKNANRRKIVHYERYNCLIDRLIEKGLTVVLQGREEQPVFAERKGLVDYSKTTFASIENDLALYSGCYFSILSKTGPELFSMIGYTPVLGVNYTELSLMLPNGKFRFYPKHVRRSHGEKLSWQEMLKDPSFFNVGDFSFGDSVEYEELSEEELLAALDEFIPLVENDTWDQMSSAQKAFRDALYPLHLDLHAVQAIPFETYLKQS